MNVILNDEITSLWRETIKEAEHHCAVSLKQELETYLASLLANYSKRPELAKQVFAFAMLQAQASQDELALQQTGDQCLLFAGLFPKRLERKLVKVSYLVDMGRFAYITLSHRTDDLFSHLAGQFVTLMDVLQSIRAESTLLPLEAYEQWQELGSQRALRILQSYTHRPL
jgi:hypothetical protein